MGQVEGKRGSAAESGSGERRSWEVAEIDREKRTIWGGCGGIIAQEDPVVSGSVSLSVMVNICPIVIIDVSFCIF